MKTHQQDRVLTHHDREAMQRTPDQELHHLTKNLQMAFRFLLTNPLTAKCETDIVIRCASGPHVCCNDAIVHSNAANGFISFEAPAKAKKKFFENAGLLHISWSGNNTPFILVISRRCPTNCQHCNLQPRFLIFCKLCKDLSFLMSARDRKPLIDSLTQSSDEPT